MYKMGDKLLNLNTKAILVVISDDGDARIQVVPKHHWDMYRELYCASYCYFVYWDTVRLWTPLDELL